MAISTMEQLFKALIASTTSEQVSQALTDIGDHAGVEINEPFGEMGLEWHPFGDSLSNISSTGLATKSGRSLTERVTNAMDAILEDRVPSGVTTLPRSCREAAAQWFGRHTTGPDDGLFKWNFGQNGFDRLINVVLTARTPNNAATIDVLDTGIGLGPERFCDTILSLQEGNKLKKHYLIGAFGQGGASTLEYSDFVVIVSRSRSNPDVVSFTVVRVINLGNDYKEDAYAYLCLGRKDPAMPPVVPHIDMKTAEPILLYGKSSLTRDPPALSVGTLVRHVGYKLPGLSGALGPAATNLYHFMHIALFDPLLPFRVIDLRDPDNAKDELITGSRNRLMRLLERKPKDDRPDEQKDRREIRHHRPLEYIKPFGATSPCVGIEYWVVFGYKKIDGPEKWRLRPSSNELFISKGNPIVGTLNGQNQGEQSAKLLRELGLAMVANHIIIHIDASGAESKIRRQLFSTNREGFKDGPVLESIMSNLREMLEEDADLHTIETELTERLTKRDSEQTNTVVRDQITRLLLESGFKVSKPGLSVKKGEGGEVVPMPPTKKGVVHVKPPPLPTLPYPQVSKFDIRYPEDSLRVTLNGSGSMMVETDADDRFDEEGRIAIRFEPPYLDVAGKSQLHGGRIRWRLHPIQSDQVKAGQLGKVVVAITKPDGVQLLRELPYELLPAREIQQKVEKGLVPPFEIYPVSPYKDEDAETWGNLWPDLTDETSAEERAKVAYKTMRRNGDIIVYYSIAFGPYAAAIEKLKSQSSAKAALFDTFYQVWIGYHAILQENERTKSGAELENDLFNTLMEEERTRVATVQVKQALQTATMKYDLTRAESTAEVT